MKPYLVANAGDGRVFSRMAALAAAIFGTSMAAVSLVDDQRNHFLGTHGLEPVRDIPRDQGLCGAVVDGEIPAVYSALVDDPRAASNPFVRKNDIQFYACAPIRDVLGNVLGTVAVMDTAVRTPAGDQLSRLDDVAAVMMEQLELRRSSHEALREERRRSDAAEYASQDARVDYDRAVKARDEARRDRDDARYGHREAELERIDAWGDRDRAFKDRDDAERDRDFAEHDRDEVAQYATVLQRTLLPPILPQIDGMVVSAHYHPASARQVGGDFYDVFALSDDRWAFFIGDVEGHGVEAAVVTSLIRYTLRAAALHHRDLTAALTELNTVMMREVTRRRLCTVLLGSVQRDDDGGFGVTLATGGHLPALLLDPSEMAAYPVRPTSGMVVGAFPEAEFQTCSVRLRPGQTLVLYTDGIVEARRGDAAFDESSLAAFLAERANVDLGSLMADLRTLVPKLNPSDDVAVLALSAIG
ncbi:PP2C family protein-serine/threonine phosphatase [Mycobacterium sp. Root135]|uniref:PP2C family protein-serine/threonine phosphatase n=1 Tax=Mycobacterium sp. Root135 TaxID=1736457 RepID=UPI001F3BA668|nr:PP2C family protein-serine/threonine phosphatase [Mycobacterium sp. Root135]